MKVNQNSLAKALILVIALGAGGATVNARATVTRTSDQTPKTTYSPLADPDTNDTRSTTTSPDRTGGNETTNHQ